MYSDKNKKGVPRIVLFLLIAAAAVIMWYFAAGRSARDISEEGAAAVRSAIQRGARQCYAVEGIYPPTLEYLEENYGLQVNTRDFYIRYEIFASNIAPEVTVTGK